MTRSYPMIATFPPPPVCPDCGGPIAHVDADCQACEKKAAMWCFPSPNQIERDKRRIRAKRERARAKEPVDTRVYEKAVVSTVGIGR